LKLEKNQKKLKRFKMKEWLEYQMKLYCTHFNFCRGHGGLRYKDERGVECKNTPAREAGIIESKWTLRELLKFRGVKTSIG
jgi:hypothetical protein